MGYWGYGIMDGDSPREVKQRYKENLYYMATKEEAFAKIKEDMFNESEECEKSRKILALAYVEMDSFDRISEDVVLAVIVAVAYESSDAVISQWKEPELRRQALDTFVEQVEKYRQKNA